MFVLDDRMDPDLETEAAEDRVNREVYPLEGMRQALASAFVGMGVLMVAEESKKTA